MSKRSKKLEILKTLNPIGDRIKWTRSKLGITARQVCLDLDIPSSSFSDLENGCRSMILENILQLSHYFNELWQDRFIGSYPYYNGRAIKKIGFMFIAFGDNYIEENPEELIENLKKRIVELETERINVKSLIGIKVI